MSLVIGLPADRKLIEPHQFHCVGEKYLTAVTDAMGATPLIIPALADRMSAAAVLERLDGLMLTGAYSNIEPHHYKGGDPFEGSPADPARDANNLSLIRLALQAGMPILGICRGLQEVNVALGGTLHQKIHQQPGFSDHREDPGAPLDQQYGPSHPIRILPGGMLSALWPEASATVNSVHGQGINRIAEPLRIEALADDGVIEAVSLQTEASFLLAVQWHPEWKVLENPFYTSLFAAFKAACESYRGRSWA